MSPRRAFALILPYIAILVGLCGFRNGWLAFAIYHLGIVLVISVGRRWGLARELARGWKWWLALTGMVFGALGCVFILLFLPHLGLAPGLAGKLAGLGLSGFSWTLFVAYHALVNPWLEELYWRGLLGSKAWHPVVEDFAFAGYHILVLAFFVAWPWLMVAFVALAVAGWAWRGMARRSGGLLVPALSHLVADASVMALAWVVSRGEP